MPEEIVPMHNKEKCQLGRGKGQKDWHQSGISYIKQRAVCCSNIYWFAMVTSTSTPGSMLMLVICLTSSAGEYKSMIRLWILIWNRSQVLVPSPHGDLRVVILKTLVGMRTGPQTFKSLLIARFLSSAQTFSTAST
jgi:hypothetical protein